MINASEMSVPHGASVTATVNPPETSVRLYARDGRSLLVDPADVERWLADGYRRERLDVAAVAGEVDLLFASTRGAVAAYVTDVLTTGVIDRSAEAQERVAQAAISDLGERLTTLFLAIDEQMDTKEADPVILPDGTRMDPTQAPGATPTPTPAAPQA